MSSVEFHEKGRRHQASVAKRLKTIGRQSLRTQAHNESEKTMLRRMETAAAQAYRRDVEGGSTDITAAAAIQHCLATKYADLPKWLEAMSESGHKYYYHQDTNESTWQIPIEGYQTLAIQKEIADEVSRIQWAAVRPKTKAEERLEAAEAQYDKAERDAAANREKLKAYRVEDIKPVEPAPIIAPGKTDPYGPWQAVPELEQPTIDYQLPKETKEYYYDLPTAEEPPPPVKEFKTKTVESLGGSSGNASFKKRKLGGGAKRNARQRNDND